jgi:hypothetical protein
MHAAYVDSALLLPLLLLNVCGRRYDAFAAKFPFLCTTSVKANSYKK